MKFDNFNSAFNDITHTAKKKKILKNSKILNIINVFLYIIQRIIIHNEI